MALRGYGQQILTGSAVMRNLQLIQILFRNTHSAGMHLLFHKLFPYLLQGFVILYRLEYLLILIPVNHGLCTFTHDTIAMLFLKIGSLGLFSHLFIQIVTVVCLLLLFSENWSPGKFTHDMLISCFYRKTVGGLKLMDLPGVEALQVPGYISHFLSLYC